MCKTITLIKWYLNGVNTPPHRDAEIHRSTGRGGNFYSQIADLTRRQRTRHSPGRRSGKKTLLKCIMGNVVSSVLVSARLSMRKSPDISACAASVLTHPFFESVFKVHQLFGSVIPHLSIWSSPLSVDYLFNLGIRQRFVFLFLIVQFESYWFCALLPILLQKKAIKFWRFILKPHYVGTDGGDTIHSIKGDCTIIFYVKKSDMKLL